MSLLLMRMLLLFVLSMLPPAVVSDVAAVVVDVNGVENEAILCVSCLVVVLLSPSVCMSLSATPV